MMFSVAIIGADGAGKTTVARAVGEHVSFRVAYFYMGSNLEACNCALPTTWLIRFGKRLRGKSKQMGGPPDPNRAAPDFRGMRGKLRAIKSALSMFHRLSDQYFRLTVASVYRRLGRVVIFDRHHYIDYHAYDISGDKQRNVIQRIHGFFLQRWFPKPDVVIFLDAPSDVLFARKGEGTIELLDLRRQDYLKLRSEVPQFYSVDASKPIHEVAKEVANRIADYREKLRR